MRRRFFTIALALAATMLVAAAAESVHAQGGGGRRGGFGRGGFGFGRTTHQLQIVALPEVETDLKLTDEQKTQIADLSDEFDDERRDLGFGGGGGGGFSPEAQAERAKLNADYAGKLNELLEEPQQKRLQEIYVQVNGTNALLDDAIATALKISDEQKEKFETVRQDQFDAQREAFQDLQGADREEIQARMAELTKARDDAYLAVLTDEQKTQFEGMKGEKLEIDMSQLRGRFGRGGGGGGFGGGGGGGRRGNRGGDDAGGRPAGDGGGDDQGA